MSALHDAQGMLLTPATSDVLMWSGSHLVTQPIPTCSQRAPKKALQLASRSFSIHQSRLLSTVQCVPQKPCVISPMNEPLPQLPLIWLLGASMSMPAFVAPGRK